MLLFFCKTIRFFFSSKIIHCQLEDSKTSKTDTMDIGTTGALMIKNKVRKTLVKEIKKLIINNEIVIALLLQYQHLHILKYLLYLFFV